MNWIGHVLFAFFISLILISSYIYITKTSVTSDFIISSSIFIVSVLIGSIIPDLDSPSSLFFRIFELIVGAAIAWFAVQTLGFTLTALALAFGVFVVFRLLAGLVIPRHRGFIHSLAFVVILLIPTYFLTSNVIITLGIFTGFWSHLWGDGIPFKVV